MATSRRHSQLVQQLVDAGAKIGVTLADRQGKQTGYGVLHAAIFTDPITYKHKDPC